MMEPKESAWDIEWNHVFYGYWWSLRERSATRWNVELHFSFTRAGMIERAMRIARRKKRKEKKKGVFEFGVPDPNQ